MLWVGMVARSWVWRSGGTELSLSHLYAPDGGHTPVSDPCSAQTCSATPSVGLCPSLSTPTFLPIILLSKLPYNYLPQLNDLILTDGHVSHLALVILHSRVSAVHRVFKELVCMQPHARASG